MSSQISVFQGDTAPIVIRVRTNKAPINLSNCGLRIIIVKNMNDETPLLDTLITEHIDAVNGISQFTPYSLINGVYKITMQLIDVNNLVKGLLKIPYVVISMPEAL
jgi:hypothetical protein